MSDAPQIPVPSPCINVCTIDEESGLCLGCARSLREVAQWKRMSEEQKQAVINQLPARKQKMRETGADIRWRDE